MRRLLAVVAAGCLLVAGLVVAFRVAAQPVGICAKYGPAYVEHVIRPHDAAPGPGLEGMGATGTLTDIGQIACVPREMKRRLDDPNAPNNRGHLDPRKDRR